MRDRILIIDDEAHIRRMMRLTLEAAGYGVVEATDGAEGIKLFADGAKWAAVILDQRMPDIDGLETLRELKRHDENARVIMATAYASIDLAVDAMKLGATDFVRKPMTPEVLRNAVTAALTKTPSQREVSSATKKESFAEPIPSIQTITMNGFTILDDEETSALEPEHRRFIVVSPDGQRHDVLVEIESEVTDFVERMTGRKLPFQDSFWTSQTRRLLSDFLWNEGKVPPTRRLVLRDLEPDRLLVAARWKSTKA
jgi:DNA-binding response OmpR family regulator